ncbi:MAG: hypothetical protein H7833_06345 [Magnetococcus sp. DMHC-1]
MAFELIGHDVRRRVSQSFEQLSEKAIRCLGVPAFPNKNVQDNAFLIYCLPWVVLFSVDLDENLIKMPSVADRPNLARTRLAKSLPNVRHHWRTVSKVTSMPQSAELPPYSCNSRRSGHKAKPHG